MKFKIGMVILCLSVLSACDSGSNAPVAPNDLPKTDPPKIEADDTSVNNTTASVQTTTTTASTATEVVLATGMATPDSAEAEARLVKATRDGDTLTVTVRFKKLGEETGSATFYNGAGIYLENCYLVSGNKKYFILKDSEGKWLAPNELTLPYRSGGTASWSTTFPAPPAGQQATLHMDKVEPLGPFTVP